MTTSIEQRGDSLGDTAKQANHNSLNCGALWLPTESLRGAPGDVEVRDRRLAAGDRLREVLHEARSQGRGRCRGNIGRVGKTRERQNRAKGQKRRRKAERENVAINSDFKKKSFGNEKWNSRPIKNDMFLYIIKKGGCRGGKKRLQHETM